MFISEVTMNKGDLVYWYSPKMIKPKCWKAELMSGRFSHYEDWFDVSFSAQPKTKIKNAIIRSLTHSYASFVVEADEVSKNPDDLIDKKQEIESYEFEAEIDLYYRND